MPAQRLEEIEHLLDRLRIENANTPILVEGTRDEAALRVLGCRGNVVRLNDGATVLGTAERIAEAHPRIVLLTDWDRTGGTLHRRLKEVLEAEGVAIDEDFRRALARLVSKETRTVEGLPSVLDRLREKLGRTGRPH